MPLLHISLRAGKPEAYRQAIFDSLYRAMHETLNVPEDDQFISRCDGYTSVTFKVSQKGNDVCGEVVVERELLDALLGGVRNVSQE